MLLRLGSSSSPSCPPLALDDAAVVLHAICTMPILSHGLSLFPMLTLEASPWLYLYHALIACRSFFFAIWLFFETIFTIRPLAKQFLKIDRFSASSYSTPWYVARRRVRERRGSATLSTTMVVKNTWPDHGVKWRSAEPHTSALNDLAPRAAVVHGEAQFARRPTYLGVLPFIT